MAELFSSMLEVVENAAESFGDKPLKAQPVHKVDEAKPGEQEFGQPASGAPKSFAHGLHYPAGGAKPKSAALLIDALLPIVGKIAHLMLERGVMNAERRWQRGDGMSKGPGFLMRQVVKELEAADDGTLTRAELEDALVPLGFRSDNILRAVRALDRIHLLRLAEGRFAETSRVILFQPVETPIPEDQILEMLKSMR